MTFLISAKIQDGSQNFVPKLNAFFFAFYAEFQDGRQSGGKVTFEKSYQ